MKLFKKLAAAALAAVLALAMVGCGSSASLKDELLKMAMDQMTVAGGTANHSKELDALAAKLVQEADKAAALEANKDEDVKGILTNNEVVKAAGIDTNANGYILNAAPNVQFKSSGALMEYTQLQWMVKAINPYTTNDGSNRAVKIGTIEQLGDNVDIGVAMGKIGGKEPHSFFVKLLIGLLIIVPKLLPIFKKIKRQHFLSSKT